jgi:hypothetical protein
MSEEFVNERKPETKTEKDSISRQLLIIILIITIVIGSAVALIGWIAGWQTSTQFSNGFFISGSVVGLVGLLTVLGGYRARASFGIQYSQSTSDMNLSERAKLWIKDLNQGYNALIVCIVSGALLIGLAILIDKLFA